MLERNIRNHHPAACSQWIWHNSSLLCTWQGIRLWQSFFRRCTCSVKVSWTNIACNTSCLRCYGHVHNPLHLQWQSEQVSRGSTGTKMEAEKTQINSQPPTRQGFSRSQNIKSQLPDKHITELWQGRCTAISRRSWMNSWPWFVHTSTVHTAGLAMALKWDCTAASRNNWCWWKWLSQEKVMQIMMTKSSRLASML